MGNSKRYGNQKDQTIITSRLYIKFVLWEKVKATVQNNDQLVNW